MITAAVKEKCFVLGPSYFVRLYFVAVNPNLQPRTNKVPSSKYQDQRFTPSPTLLGKTQLPADRLSRPAIESLVSARVDLDEFSRS